jgi:methionyl-tRNA synthetase
MNKKESVYITTTLPYVNSDPHLGHALEFVHADIFARYNKFVGNDVFFNIGTDEHGQKIFDKAKEEGKETQDYVDEYSDRFKNFAEKLDIGYTNFVRTTDSAHKKAAQEFWKLCDKNGDIEKKLYKVKYCVGCELEKTDSELVEGKCELHPNKDLEIREEENYFFKFSNYQDKLRDFYKEKSDFVVPEHRLNEIKAFVEGGLQDFSISRVKEKMEWGVPVPGDEDHVMYVWFDALVNYLSTIGWPDESYKDWWPVDVQFAGKDNLRQQSAMWQAMLMSAGVETSKQIVIHGFITSDGQKMSKSLGNGVDPLELVEEYGTDTVRYYLARHINSFEDSDYTDEKFKEAYNANLVNGLGNLVNRILKMSETHLSEAVALKEEPDALSHRDQFISKYEFSSAMVAIWRKISAIDEEIALKEPFKLVKIDKEAAIDVIKKLVQDLYTVGKLLSPIMPETSEKIILSIKANKKPDEPLFPRKS